MTKGLELITEEKVLLPSIILLEDDKYINQNGVYVVLLPSIILLEDDLAPLNNDVSSVLLPSIILLEDDKKISIEVLS